MPEQTNRFFYMVIYQFRIGNEETRTQKGTGLGLFIVAEFVKMQNGKITSRENIPQGANFEITF